MSLQLQIKPLTLLKLVAANKIVEAEVLIATEPSLIEELCGFLKEAKLSGYFYTLIRDTSIIDQLTQQQHEVIHNRWLRQSDLNSAYLAMLIELQNRLTSEGVDMLILKGLAIATRFAGGMDRRFMWDTDILVRPEQMQTTIDVAKNMGFAELDSHLSTAILDFFDFHAVEIHRQQLSIDIHWSIRSQHGYRFDYRRIQADAQSIMIGGHPFRTLADQDALTFALIEIASDLERSHFKMRALWDVYLMLKAMDSVVDWPLFFQQRKQQRLLSIVINIFELCLLVLDCRVEFPALSQALTAHQALLLIDDRANALEIISRPPQNFKNRCWYARLQPMPQPLYWLWWLSTAPLRFAITRKL